VSARSLAGDVDPTSDPLTYPGLTVNSPAALVLDQHLWSLRPAQTPVGQWIVDDDQRPLDEVLTEAGAAAMAERTPMLSVGSNASPAQIARKLLRAGLQPAVPITAVQVEGIATGVAACVSAPGYLPATPLHAPGHTSRMHLTWLDDDSLAVTDDTEPDYQRTSLPSRYTVALPTGQIITHCHLYVCLQGCLLDRTGQPRPAASQHHLISELLTDLPALTLNQHPLREPQEFITAMRADPAHRAHARQLMHSTGLAHLQPELLPTLNPR
jgi:hypothetical protein